MTFNAQAFMDGSQAADFSTERKLVAPGTYLFTIIHEPEGTENGGGYKAIRVDSGVSQKGNAWARLLVPVKVMARVDGTNIDAADQERILNYQCFLDLDGAGGLDRSEGANVALGRLLLAIGQHGDPSWSPLKMMGAQFLAQVRHRSYTDSTGENREAEEVVQPAPANV